jgi:acetyltransferase-like isoleucine patch superfamily enzyme
MGYNNYLKSIVFSNTFIFNVFSFIYSFPTNLQIKGRYKNKIITKGAFLKNTKIECRGENNTISIEPENRLKKCKILILGNNCNIKIAKHCRLANLELWIEDDKSEIEIGFRTTIEGGHIASTEGHSIKIGEDCMFSHAVVIRNGDSHSIFNKSTNQRINLAQDVQIGEHVWLGEGVKILKGSSVEDGAIVATGAIVSGIVEKNSIFAGIPAKKVKENIKWDRERH